MEDNRKALDRQAAKKKRGRAATASQGNAKKNGTGGTAAKRTKTAYGGDDHPGAASPPASRVAAEWQPPVGSWEDKLEIIGVHITPETGRLWVMVEWKEDGRKTQHLTDTIYLRCPQKVRPVFSRDTEVNLTPTRLYYLLYL